MRQAVDESFRAPSMQVLLHQSFWKIRSNCQSCINACNSCMTNAENKDRILQNEWWHCSHKVSDWITRGVMKEFCMAVLWHKCHLSGKKRIRLRTFLLTQSKATSNCTRLCTKMVIHFTSALMYWLSNVVFTQGTDQWIQMLLPWPTYRHRLWQGYWKLQHMEAALNAETKLPSLQVCGLSLGSACSQG